MLISIVENGQVRTREFLLISHRGGRGFGPENTLESLEKAIGFGVEMVETDIRTSADGVPVIHHSPFIGIHLLSHLTVSEIKERGPGIPTLDEYLRLADARCALNLEIKRCPACLLAKLLDPWRDSASFLVTSFDTEFLADFKAMGAVCETGLLSQYKVEPGNAVKEAVQNGVRVILPVAFYVSTRLVRMAHQAGLKVIPWTVNGLENLRGLLGMGVDGVITDDYGEFDGYLRSEILLEDEGERLRDTG
jgi:glycerophosphoryl diester phosphodiesterase